MNIVNYLKYQLQVIKTYKNPWLYWSIVAGFIKSGEYKLNLSINKQFYIRPAMGDIYLVNDVYLFKEYEQVLSHLKHKNNLVIDVGAHIGAFSLLVGDICQKILAYEPDPDTYRQLSKNIHLNKKTNIRTFPLAVACKQMTTNWYRSPKGSGGNSIIDTDGSKLKSGTVPCTTLEKIITDHKLNKIDLLKLDCEGAEFQILLHLKNQYFKLINAIVLEYHDHLSASNHHQLMTHLKQCGYKIQSNHVINQKTGIILATYKSHR